MSAFIHNSWEGMLRDERRVTTALSDAFSREQESRKRAEQRADQWRTKALIWCGIAQVLCAAWVGYGLVRLYIWWAR